METLAEWGEEGWAEDWVDRRENRGIWRDETWKGERDVPLQQRCWGLIVTLQNMMCLSPSESCPLTCGAVTVPAELQKSLGSGNTCRADRTGQSSAWHSCLWILSQRGNGVLFLFFHIFNCKAVSANNLDASGMHEKATKKHGSTLGPSLLVHFGLVIEVMTMNVQLWVWWLELGYGSLQVPFPLLSVLIAHCPWDLWAVCVFQHLLTLCGIIGEACKGIKELYQGVVGGHLYWARAA